MGSTTTLWESLHSFFPWHTSHKVNVDAKGVPQEIKINVSGLPNIRHIGVDVHDVTRNAGITVLYSIAFLFFSLGVYLLVSAVTQLVCGAYVAVIHLGAGTALVISTVAAWVHWVGFWNAVMISYLVIVNKTEHIRSCKCPYTPIKNGGKLPLCGVVWLICVGGLLIQLGIKMMSID